MSKRQIYLNYKKNLAQSKNSFKNVFKAELTINQKTKNE